MHTHKRPVTIFACLAIAFFTGAPSAWAVPASTTALTLSANTVASGTPVTLTALVFSGANPVAPGLVTFLDGKVVLGSAQLLGNGTATLKVRLGIGIHEISADFAGTNRYAKSNSDQLGLSVTGKLTTQTSISSSGSPGSYMLTGTVTTSEPPAPTGNVSFTDQTNANALGMASLGSATITQTFQPQVPYDDGGYASSVVAGDFNGDGVPDLVTAHLHFFGVRLGLGDGSFQRPQVTYATGNDPVSIAADDFNGDGMLDLVVSNFDNRTVGVLLGKGDGTFQPQVTYSGGGSLGYIAVADFNGDGISDLATPSGTPSTRVNVLLGKGDGTFQATVTYPVGVNPESVAAGDFNSDGAPDLAVANSGDGTVSVLFGRGDGTFQPQVTYNVGGAQIDRSRRFQPRWNARSRRTQF
jgi:hypothetical protein